MTALLDDLLSTLRAQAEQVRQLELLLAEERAALLAFDTRTVAQITAEKERRLGELKRLDAARLLCLRRLAGALGVAPEALTLSSVAALTGAGDRLEPLGRALRGDLNRLTTVNDGNRVLVEHSLRHVRALLETVRTCLQETPTYGAGGRHAEGPEARAVLNRTA
jgi:flagellar biosynthesis/type III secretory pathway chaperone